MKRLLLVAVLFCLFALAARGDGALTDDEVKARIVKFGHWLSRGRYCRIMLDGETKQWTHPLW